MNTQEAIERLPWLVNGSLEESEALEVRRHLSDSAECRRELGRVLEASRIFDARLPVASLLDYVEGRETAPFGRELIGRYLNVNPAAREEWQMASESLQGAIAADRAAQPAAAVVPFPDRTPAPVARATAWRRLATAASLAFAVCLAGWMYTLQDDDAGRLVNPQFVELDLVDSEIVLRDGSAADAVPTPIARQAGRPLLLALPGSGGGSRYVELTDADGEVAWAPVGPIEPDGAWYYHVVVPDDLAPGRYVVQLYRSTDDERVAAERFNIDLR